MVSILFTQRWMQTIFIMDQDVSVYALMEKEHAKPLSLLLTGQELKPILINS